MNEVHEAVKSSVKISKKGIRLSWWLLVVAIVAFGAVFYILSTLTNKSAVTKTNPDTAEEIKTKQTLSSMRGDIVRFYEANKTYVGWQPSEALQNNVKKYGSEIKTKLDKDSYMIYAKMPSSKLTFCMDNNGTPGFTGELKSVNKTTCQ